MIEQYYVALFNMANDFVDSKHLNEDQIRLAIYEALKHYRQCLLSHLETHKYPIESHDRFESLLKQFNL